MIPASGTGYLSVWSGLVLPDAGAGGTTAAGAPSGLEGSGSGRTGPGRARRAGEDDGGIRRTDALYIGVRQGTRPARPADWFTMIAAATGAAKGK